MTDEWHGALEDGDESVSGQDPGSDSGLDSGLEPELDTDHEGIRILGSPVGGLRPAAERPDPSRPVIRFPRPEVRDPNRLGPVPVVRGERSQELDPEPRRRRRDPQPVGQAIDPGPAGAERIEPRHAPQEETLVTDATQQGDDLETWSSLIGDETVAEPREPRDEVDLDLTEAEASTTTDRPVRVVDETMEHASIDERAVEDRVVDEREEVLVYGSDAEAPDNDFEDDARAFFEYSDRKKPTDTRRTQRRPQARAMNTPPQPRPAPAKAKGAGRNIGLAAVVGLGLAAVGGIALALGGIFTVLLITAILAMCAVEFYSATLKAGFAPASLLGLIAVITLPLGVHWKGAEAYPVVLFLTVVAGLLWYLLGVMKDRPVRNLGVTLLGVFYIGGLGSFGIRMVSEPRGISTLLAAVMLTVAYDVGGFAIGRSAGRTPLTPTSPNKTWEGTLGGALISLVVALVAVGWQGLSIFGGGSILHAVALGLLVPLAAALGDLSESLIKRDLGIKDMSEMLPGHGGFLDRFDAMLFVLPTTYYLAVALSLFQA